MNIACVYSLEYCVYAERPLLRSTTDIPFGISFIATILKNHNHRVELQVFSPEVPFEDTLRDFIADFQPRLFCITTVSTQFRFILRVAESVKKNDPNIFIVIGGVHPSLKPEETINKAYVDAVCIGEGEAAIVELAEQLEKGQRPSAIPNLWIKDRNGGIEKNPQNRFIEDLDTFPYINREMWRSWIADLYTMPSVLIGRGCPFKCSYCSNHALAKVSKGKYVRFRSCENILGEIRYILNDAPDVQIIFLEIETLGANPHFLFQLCDVLSAFNLERRKPVGFGANFAVTDVLVENAKKIHEVFSSLKKANFKFLTIGLESGSESVRHEILRRPKYSNENIIRFCDIARQYAIDINMQVLIGLPGETHSDFKETVRIVRRCSPRQCLLNIFYPYPGTDLHTMAEEMSLIVNNDPKNERRTSILKLPHFSRFQMKKEFVLFYFNVYRGQSPWLEILTNTFRYFIFSTFPGATKYYRRLRWRLKQMNV